MAIELKIPEVGESITEVEVGDWLKGMGEEVKKDEAVVTLESEKATVELPAPDSGVIAKVLKQKGEVAKVGEVIAYLEKDGQPESREPPKEKEPSKKGAEPSTGKKIGDKAAEPKSLESRVMPAA